MTASEIAAAVARQLVAESRYLESVSSFPAIRAERRRILEESERELAAVVAEVMAGRDAKTSGSPADASGRPD